MHGDASEQPGATGRGYRIERLIGAGGAAAVYEARRLGASGPGEPMVRVACKVMHAERRDAPGYRAQVWHEAVLGLRTTAGHPNLVEVLDFFDDAREQLCIVMELVDGASVAELREPEQRLPFPIARRIAVEVLEALVHLHGRNVLHRDLSLRNLLVTTGGAVKVTDLGIARVMEQGQVHTGNLRGTPMYISPEALQSLPLDARADLFSLGAVLYDLVAGQPPCGNQSMLGAIFARNATCMFEPLPPDTPGDLAELITGLIRQDRDARRPQTAAGALALLRGCDQPVASQEELAALVGCAKSRRDQALADHGPASVLPPGHVLAPRDDRGPAQCAAGEPSSRVAPADPPSDLIIEIAPDGASDAPARMAEHAGDAVPEHLDDALPDGLADRAPALVAGVAADAAPDALPDSVAEDPSGGAIRSRRGDAGRLAAWRAAAMVSIGACVLVLGFFLADGLRDVLRRDQAAVEPAPPIERSTPAVAPSPAPPVAPAPVTPEEPRHARRVDLSQRADVESRRRTLHSGPRAPRWRSAPRVSEPPRWELR